MSRRPGVRQGEIERTCKAIRRATGIFPVVIVSPDGSVQFLPAQPAPFASRAVSIHEGDVDLDRELAEWEASHGEG